MGWVSAEGDIFVLLNMYAGRYLYVAVSIYVGKGWVGGGGQVIYLLILLICMRLGIIHLYLGRERSNPSCFFYSVCM